MVPSNWETFQWRASLLPHWSSWELFFDLFVEIPDEVSQRNIHKQDGQNGWIWCFFPARIEQPKVDIKLALECNLLFFEDGYWSDPVLSFSIFPAAKLIITKHIVSCCRNTSRKSFGNLLSLLLRNYRAGNSWFRMELHFKAKVEKYGKQRGSSGSCCHFEAHSTEIFRWSINGDLWFVNIEGL